MLITTAQRQSPLNEAKAQQLARELHARYVPREKRSLARLRRDYDEDDILTVAEQVLRFYAGGGDDSQPLFFHPSMAAVRLKRLQQGEKDNLLLACKISPGDEVLDCTAGMASDSIVFAHAVGARGKVVAVESAPITALITREGLRTYTSDIEGLEAAMRRVQLIQASYIDVLRGLPSQSFDLVYFDPMFRKAKHDSNWITPLRMLANHEALCQEAIVEAMRVARKRVVVKERRESYEFARLGISNVQYFSGDIAYGVIQR